MENGLAREKFVRRKKVYAITERGMSVFRAISFQRYLDKVSKSIKAMSTTAEAVSPPTIQGDESRKGEIKWTDVAGGTPLTKAIKHRV